MSTKRTQSRETAHYRNLQAADKKSGRRAKPRAVTLTPAARQKEKFDAALAAFDRGALRTARRLFEQVLRLRGRLRAKARKYLERIRTRQQTTREAARKGTARKQTLGRTTTRKKARAGAIRVPAQKAAVGRPAKRGAPGRTMLTPGDDRTARRGKSLAEHGAPHIRATGSVSIGQGRRVKIRFGRPKVPRRITISPAAGAAQPRVESTQYEGATPAKVAGDRIDIDATAAPPDLTIDVPSPPNVTPPSPTRRMAAPLPVLVVSSPTPGQAESAGTPAVIETIVRRTPHMEPLVGDQLIRPGNEFRVLIYLDTGPATAGEESAEIIIRAPGSVSEFELEVWFATTPHFHITGDRARRLWLRVNQLDSRSGETDPKRPTTAFFDVKVRTNHDDWDHAFLFAYFFYNGRPCGKVARGITISPAAGAAQPRVESTQYEGATPAKVAGDRIDIDATAAPPDLTIEITDPERNLQRMRCRVSTSLLPKKKRLQPMVWHLPQRTDVLVEELMQSFVEPGINNRQRLLRLKGAGRLLFDAAPEEFKRLFWRLVDERKPLRTIYVVSEDPYIPWELMIPHRRQPDGSDDRRPRPLGVEFAVGRWIPQNYLSPRQRIRLTSSFVIAPDYPGPRPKPLAFSADEAAFVCKQITGFPIVPADLDTIDSTLQKGGATLLHFVCHGAQTGLVGLQKIYLAGQQTLTSLELGQMDGMVTACRKKPLVFINACEVGRTTLALAGVGGFAKAFIDLQASGVIAPLWSVKDSLAHEVATEFYTRVKQDPRIPFAEILRDIRAKAYTTGEDTYAAYCFYGDPLAISVDNDANA